MKKLLTAAQVGELLGVTDETARRYIRQHMACMMLPGGDLRVEEAEVERWLESTRQAPETVFQAARKMKPRTPHRYDPELFEADGRIRRRRA